MHEEYMSPYRSLVTALLSQAIKDVHHEDPEVQHVARHWLRHDAFCEEICEWLGYNRAVLHETLEYELARSA